jgi:hypothetical protein
MDVSKEENGNSLQEEKSIQHARNPLSREGIEKLRQFQNQLLQEHGGTPLGSSVELLHEARQRSPRLKGGAYFGKPRSCPVPQVSAWEPFAKNA